MNDTGTTRYTAGTAAQSTATIPRRRFLSRVGVATMAGSAVLLAGCGSPPTGHASSGLVPLAATRTSAASTTVPSKSTPVAGAAPAQTAAERTITVTGHGEATGRPDQATVTLGVHTEATTAEEAISANSQKMQDVLAALKDAGISANNIQTQQLQLWPRYEPKPIEQEGSRQSGYIAVNSVEVRLHDLGRVGAVIDKAVKAGGNRVERIQFEVSDTENLLDQARRAAMDDARDKAAQLAALADVGLGEVLTIRDATSPQQPSFSIARQALDAASEIPIEPGSEQVRTAVEVTWRLQ